MSSRATADFWSEQPTMAPLTQRQATARAPRIRRPLVVTRKALERDLFVYICPSGYVGKQLLRFRSIRECARYEKSRCATLSIS